MEQKSLKPSFDIFELKLSKCSFAESVLGFNIYLFPSLDLMEVSQFPKILDRMLQFVIQLLSKVSFSDNPPFLFESAVHKINKKLNTLSLLYRFFIMGVMKKMLLILNLHWTMLKKAWSFAKKRRNLLGFKNHVY